MSGWGLSVRWLRFESHINHGQSSPSFYITGEGRRWLSVSFKKITVGTRTWKTQSLGAVKRVKKVPGDREIEGG